MSETGRCPICNIDMDTTKTIYWQRKNLSFPYRIYHCRYHGAFVWRRRKYELVDFSKLQSDAIITDLPPESRVAHALRVQSVDYTIVIMKCPYCEEEWKQHKEFPPDRKVRCPNGHLIPFEKAFKRLS